MSFNDSRLISLAKLFRRRGLRHGVNAIATALAQKQLSAPLNALDDFRIVLTEDRPAMLTSPESGPLRINWLIPGIGIAQGGLFNVFRTIQQLEAWGHENRVYVLGSLPEGSALAKEQVRQRYFAINGEVEALSDTIKDSDALIATSWPTAYAARGVGNTAQKFYFVQDLEHMFYASGSLHEFARQTYMFGFRGITAGTWIADMLRREFKMECSTFGFSYDRVAYASTGSRMFAPGKKRVLFYARPETERRGFELGILALSLVAKRMPDVEFILVGFPGQLLNLPFPAVFPGVLALSELGALYRSCDVALVLSHTNLSLLPLELMACGCALVSNEGPNAEWLLSEDTTSFAKPEPNSLAGAVIELLENDALRHEKVKTGLAFVQSTDWTTEIKAIESALLAREENPQQLVFHD